ncbi:DUF1189 family protein [Globicatella sanguinis]
MKKNIFKFLLKAYKEPRLFIQIIAVKFRQLRHLAIIAIMIAATSMTIGNQPYFNEISQNIADASTFVPDYQYINGQLQLAHNEKPLYYRSKNFQLVIDDSIESNKQLEDITLEKDKAKAIDSKTFINLYLFKNSAFAKVGGQFYRLSEIESAFVSRATLIRLLNALNEHPYITLFSQWISYFVVNLLTYVLLILLLTLVTTSLNHRISTPFSFWQRIKLTMAISFAPYVLIQMVKIFVPDFVGSFFALGIFLMIYLYQMVIRHTLFVKEFLLSLTEESSGNLSKFNNYFPELDYIEPENRKEKDDDNPKKIIISPDIFTGDEFNKLKRHDIVKDVDPYFNDLKPIDTKEEALAKIKRQYEEHLAKEKAKDETNQQDKASQSDDDTHEDNTNKNLIQSNDTAPHQNANENLTDSDDTAPNDNSKAITPNDSMTNIDQDEETDSIEKE